MGTYIVLIQSAAVHDVQVCTDTDCDPTKSNWVDFDNAEIYLGIKQGTSDFIKKWGAEQAGVPIENIRLVELVTM